VIFPFKIVRFQTVEFLNELHPLPIPDPSDEPLAVIVPFNIVRFQTVESLCILIPLPIPAPKFTAVA
jgi:hypothetical protein